MYPNGDLTRLAQRKTLLRAKIAVRRWECAVAGAELARPIALLDRGIETWNRFAPVLKLLGVPTIFVLLRKLRGGGIPRSKPKRGKIGTILSLLPVVLRGVRMVTALKNTRTSQPGRTTAARSNTSL